MIFLFAIIVVLFDQITKWFIQKHLFLGQSKQVISDFFQITYTTNPGAAFSILANAPVVFRTVFFLTISIVTILCIIFFSKRIAGFGAKFKISFGLILGGAIGNLIDRIRFGAIVDFLDVGLGKYRWPIFNVADSSICIGAFLLFIFVLKQDSINPL